MTITLRPATDQDTGQLRECYVRSWLSTFGGWGTGLDEDAAWERSGLARPAGPVTVADVDGAVRGLVALADGGACLDKLYVEPGHHGHGIGSALLAAVPTADHLWAFEGNTVAIAFYTRHGWSLDGARKVGRVGARTLSSVRLVRP